MRFLSFLRTPWRQRRRTKQTSLFGRSPDHPGPINGNVRSGHTMSLETLAGALAHNLVPVFRKELQTLRDTCGDHAVEQFLSYQAWMERLDVRLDDLVREAINTALAPIAGEVAATLQASLAQALIAELTPRIDGPLADMQKAWMEFGGAAFREAAQAPVVERLIATCDRIYRERRELAERAVADPVLFLHVTCRQLIEAHLSALDAVLTELHLILADLEVVPLATTPGPFDPRRQQVIGVEPTTDPERDRHVIRVVRPGYMRGSKLLCPELVIVSKQESKS